jgi:NAD(P)-dependent dehydrogenase (short-subunit alcohol dehydrogenase family)
MSERSVIITGAHGLIGSAISRHLTSNDWNVTEIDIHDYDLTSHDDVESMMIEFHHIPNLINCFAYNDHVKSTATDRQTILDMSPEAFASVIDVNVTALFDVCRSYIKYRLGNGGNIINFGASTGIVAARTDMYGGSHKNIAYSVSKAAVIHMTKILATHAVDLDQKFRVNCISPGGVQAEQGEAFQKLYGMHTPAGRMLNVNELLPAVDMLLNGRNTYMQGANIVVDGGWTVQ